jgi:hypothetical protein
MSEPEQPNWLVPETADIDEAALFAAHGKVKDRLDDSSLAAVARLMRDRSDNNEE